MSRPRKAMRRREPAPQRSLPSNDRSVRFSGAQSAVAPPSIEIIAVTVQHAAVLRGISRTLFYRFAGTAPLFPPIVKVGRASRVLLRDLQRWMEEQAPTAQKPLSLTGSVRGGNDGHA